MRVNHSRKKIVIVIKRDKKTCNKSNRKIFENFRNKEIVTKKS